MFSVQVDFHKILYKGVIGLGFLTGQQLRWVMEQGEDGKHSDGARRRRRRGFLIIHPQVPVSAPPQTVPLKFRGEIVSAVSLTIWYLTVFKAFLTKIHFFIASNLSRIMVTNNLNSTKLQLASSITQIITDITTIGRNREVTRNHITIHQDLGDKKLGFQWIEEDEEELPAFDGDAFWLIEGDSVEFKLTLDF